MTNYVIINGTNSNTITGLAINELPPITKPLMRTEKEEIDGRDGDIITKLGYSAYDKTITIGLWGTGYDVNSIISFFNKEGTITFSNEADKYYNFTMLEQFDIESLLRFKTATITFHCQPFKYPITETPVEIAYEYIEQDNVESATLNNTNGNTHLDISLKGNTSQNTTTGKNLYYHINRGTITNNGITAKWNDDGTITLNGTSTSAVDLGASTPNTKFELEAGSYIISDSQNSNDYYFQLGTQYHNQSFTITETLQLTQSIIIKSGKTLNNVVLKPMLRLSTISDDTYEPYTGGQPSPSPSYPQPINVVSGDNEVVVTGKNICDGILEQGAYNTSDGYTNISSNKYVRTPNFTILQPNTQYTLNFVNSADNKKGSILFYGKSKNFLSQLNLSTNLTFTTSNDTYYLRLDIYSSTDFTPSDITNLQIEKGDQSSQYEPYQSQTYEVNLGDIELCKIGTYQDYFTKNSGKNLFDNSVEPLLRDSHSHYSVSNNAISITSDGNINGGALWNIPIDISKQITISYEEMIETTSSTNNVITYDFSDTPITTFAYGTNISKTDKHITLIPTGKYLVLALRSTNNGGCTITNLQVEYGNQSIYEPYGTGQWCKYNAIGEYTFDGSETWSLATSGTNTNLYYSQLTYISANVLSNYFTRNDNLYNEDVEGMRGVTSNNRMWFRISNTTASDSTAFKTWLSTHNTQVDYVLATPYLSLIEDTTLIEQLDNIQNAMSYEGQTNVSQVNNDKPFIMDLIAMKDGTDEVVINNIGNTTSKPTIALEGTGDINIYLDGTQMLKATLTDKMTIDTNNLEAYNPDTMTLLNRQLVGDISKFTLASGNNTIKVDGNLTKATITSYTRWL